MTALPVNIWHEILFADGTRRIVAVSEDGMTVHVAQCREGQLCTAEVSFELAHAFALAKACLAGNERARTTPGLTRVLCAAVLCLGKAAFKAGALQALETVNHEQPDDGHRSEAQDDAADT